MDKKKKIADIKGVISRQKRYSTLAKKEGQYAEKVEKKELAKGMKEQAKDSKNEAKIAYLFSDKRKKLVKKAESKLNKIR